MGVALRLAAWLSGSALACAGAAEPPHIVYILADDFDWKDVSFHGGAIKTSHLDRLPQTGLRLERFYAQAYPTSTRAALLTGRYPRRYGLAPSPFTSNTCTSRANIRPRSIGETIPFVPKAKQDACRRSTPVRR